MSVCFPKAMFPGLFKYTHHVPVYSAFLSNSKHFVWHYQREAEASLLPILCPYAAMGMAHRPALTWHGLVWYILG